MMQEKNIFFVCTGNTCRSPMAEALARLLLAEIAPDRHDLIFKSAGTAAWPQDGIAPQAASVLQQFQIDSSGHRASQIQVDQIRQAALVLTMTAAQRDMLRQLAPAEAGKIQTLAQYAGDRGDVPDPFGRDENYYRQVADHLTTLLRRALGRLIREL